MGVATKHLLDKIDRIRAKGDQRRADRIHDARFATTSLYKTAGTCKVFTPQEVAAAKKAFQQKLQKSRRKHKIAWILTIILTPVCFYLGYLFLFMFHF
ncbi:hypothetical protein [Nonlabens sp.]|uniref:hypothetical protein n=1 Tax=Nonlabens sp. TaxID=1888209 RepID=UPI0032640AE4